MADIYFIIQIENQTKKYLHYNFKYEEYFFVTILSSACSFTTRENALDCIADLSKLYTNLDIEKYTLSRIN